MASDQTVVVFQWGDNRSNREGYGKESKKEKTVYAIYNMSIGKIEKTCGVLSELFLHL